MKVKIKNIWIIYIMLIFAILSGPLRLTNNGMTSIYRMISPFVIMFVLCHRLNDYKKDIVFMLTFLGYSILVSLAFYKRISYDQTVFAIYIFIEYVLIKYIKIKEADFEKQFWRFINIFTVITIILAWIQRYTGYIMPFMDKPVGVRTVTVFFGGVNELGGAMACVFILYIFAIIFYRRWIYIPLCGCILFFVYINDAKLSLLGIIVAVLIFSIYKIYLIRKSNGINDRNFFLFFIVLIITSIIVVYLVNPTFQFRDYHISIRNLIFDALYSIVKGELHGEYLAAGSIHDRTSAIIYGLREWRKTCLFGIGFGNSIFMLQQPEYVLPYAKSMHNIITQFLVEMGYFAIFVYAKIIVNVNRCFIKVNQSKVNLLKGVFAIAFIFISSQSSVGLLANYYTIMMVIFVCLIQTDDFVKNR